MNAARRGRLLEAASREFAANGYEAASINTILASAGFSKGSFYYYFDDKADLAGTVLLAAYDAPMSVLRTTRAPRTREDFWDEVSRVQRLMLERVEANPQTYAVIIRLSSAVLTDAQLGLRIMPLIVESTRLMTELWAAGQALGVVRGDLPPGELLTLAEALKRAAWQARFPSGHVPTTVEVEDFAAHMLDLLRRVSAPARRS